MGDEKMMFDLNSQQIKYKDILNKEFLELEVYAISDIKPNRNKTHFNLEAMQNALPDIKNKPIVGFFDKGDFEAHNGQIQLDSELNIRYWDTTYGERILGVIRESDPVEIVEVDGLHWIKFRCALWTTYCYKQVKRLLRDKNKKVSVEVTVHKSEMIDGIEEIYDFTLNGVTILGSKNGRAVLEAIPGAHASILENLDGEVMEDQRKMLSFAYERIEDQTDLVGDEPLNDINNQNTNEKEVYSGMEHHELEDKIWKSLVSHTHEVNTNDGCDLEYRYWLEAIYDTHIIIRDNFLDERFKILYEIVDDEVIIHYDTAKSLKDVDDAVKDAEQTYAIDGVGTGDDIKIDKSKDSMSNRAWGSIDKAALRKRVIKAGNFKTIAKSIFLDLREGWKDGEATKLKYPVMCIEDNTAVYNRGALASAKAYAEKNGEDAILTKINKIYKALDLNEEDNEEKEAKYVVKCNDELYSVLDKNQMEEPNVTTEPVLDNQESAEVASSIEDSAYAAAEGAEANAESAVEQTKETASSEEYAAEKPEEKNTEEKSEEKSDESCKCDCPCEDNKEEKPDEEDEACKCADEACENKEEAGCENCESSECETAPVEGEGCDGSNEGTCEEKSEPYSKGFDNEELCRIQARCDELIATCDAQAKEIKVLSAKCDQYADYEEIKTRMLTAEAAVFANKCEKMKEFAVNKMVNEKINPSDREEIETKAAAGQYNSEEDIICDIAIAIYKARPEQTERFSTEIPDVSVAKESAKSKTANMTRAERIAARCHK